ncbi:MAG: type II toxin-antitoxin system HicB family antitoxin [Desulfocapsaceae bacterium]
MRYPFAIHKDENSCYGVTVPDIPGCFSAGDTIDEAIANAHEAIIGHLEILAEQDVFAPNASDIEGLQGNPDYSGATWFIADIDVSSFLKGTTKATVTLPKSVIRRIDELVKSGQAKSRSSFLANSAIHMMNGCEKHC